VLGAAFANYGTKLKFLLRIDDALDIFAVHGIGGLVGNVCTAFFAADYIAHLDHVQVIKGGWLNHNWIQLGYQLADSFTGGAYSFVGTTLILFLLNMIPGMHLRAKEEAEILGIDDAEIGEFAYDYVELTREVLNDMDPAAAEMGSLYSGQEHHQSRRFSESLGREKHINGIPLTDRIYGGQSAHHP
jgi:Amt family ammonium transporter